MASWPSAPTEPVAPSVSPALTRALPSDLVVRIESLLTALDQAGSLADLDLPGARLHALKSDRKGFLALELSGNWRLVFRFEDGDAYDVEVVDYYRS